MLRKLILAGALLALAAVPVAGAAKAQRPVELLPGVTYDRQLTFTPHGPVVLHVVTAPRPGGLYTLGPALSNGAVVGLERLTDLQKRLSPQTTAVGVNGDYFSAGGQPSGVVVQSGALVTAPRPDRSSVGVDATGLLHVDRVTYVGNWRGTGQRRRFQLNVAGGNNVAVLYTPAYGPTTPAAANSVEAVLPSFGPLTAGADVTATVAQVRTGGGTPIPPGGAVLVGRGSQAPFIQREAPAGQTVVLRATLTPSWSMTQALGGGPLLVRNGKPVFNAGEAFSTDLLIPRLARTAVGQLADGRILLVVADGGQPGYSVGMTNFELAIALVRLGAVTGAALGSGGPATLALEGQLLNRPTTAEAPLANALLLGYEGVYAPPPSEPVLSPNGDGVAESSQLAYKVVRPSEVVAQLTGPDGRVYAGDAGHRDPGTRTFAVPPPTAGPAALPEGTWRWTVSSTDDRGRRSTTERTFLLDNTLGALGLDQQLLRIGRGGATLRIHFALARPATVVTTVETLTGAVLRIVSNGQLQPGQIDLTWDARDSRNRLVRSAKLVVHVRATNEIGTVDLVAPFTARRVA